MVAMVTSNGIMRVPFYWTLQEGSKFILAIYNYFQILLQNQLHYG